MQKDLVQDRQGCLESEMEGGNIGMMVWRKGGRGGGGGEHLTSIRERDERVNVHCWRSMSICTISKKKGSLLLR